MEKNISNATSVVDEGLRSYMIKVYNFMAGGLVVTALAAWATINTPLFNIFFTQTANGYYTMSVLGWVAFIAPLVMVFAFGWVLNRGTAKQVQALFWGYAAIMGVGLAPILLVYTSASVTRIFMISAAMFSALSLYGYTTKRDLTKMGSFMMMGLIGVIIAMIVNIFMKSPAMYYALSVLTVVIFTGLTAYDTQKIRAMYTHYDEGDTITKKAVAGALSLYLDFINLFLALLRLFGDRR